MKGFGYGDGFDEEDWEEEVRMDGFGCEHIWIGGWRGVALLGGDRIMHLHAQADLFAPLLFLFFFFLGTDIAPLPLFFHSSSCLSFLFFWHSCAPPPLHFLLLLHLRLCTSTRLR